MNGKERNEHQTVCPRCGADADWAFLNTEKSEIEIMCPNCGRYVMTREEFDAAASEDAEINEPETR